MGFVAGLFYGSLDSFAWAPSQPETALHLAVKSSVLDEILQVQIQARPAKEPDGFFGGPGSPVMWCMSRNDSQRYRFAVDFI